MEQNSLETKIAVLTQQVNDLSARVERGFADIKESAVSRITNHESRIVELEKMKEECKKDISFIIDRNALILKIGIGALTLIASLLIFHVTGGTFKL